MKVFAYPIENVTGVFSLEREKFFKLMLSLGNRSFQAEFVEMPEPDAINYLLWQVHHALSFNGETTDLNECPKNAYSVSGGQFSIDVKKCDNCLKCV